MRSLPLLAMLSLAAAAPAQPIGGDVKSVGFRGQADMSQFVARRGLWTPICVDLQATSPTAKEVEVRFATRDLDGDTVEYSSGPVTLGAGVRRAWVYACLGDNDFFGASVQVLDADGALITRMRMPGCEAVPEYTQLIIDISRKPVLALTSRSFASEGDWATRSYYRAIRAGRMELSEVPDRWIGLQSADVIVWDEPKPTDLTIAQTEALIEWVRNGGQLVIGIGPSADDLRNTPLAPILPVSGDTPAEVATLDNLGTFVLQREPRPMTVATAKARPEAQVRYVANAGVDKQYDFIVSWPVGSGRVTTCATRLMDLAPEGVTPRDAFYEAFFDVTRLPPAIRAAFAQRQTNMLAQETSLHSRLTSLTRFSGQTSLLILLALLFVAVYIFVATAASWMWLQQRKLTALSWTVFAGIAVVAGFASLGAVRLTKASGAKSTSFVDCETGSPACRVWSYVGYRTAQRRVVEVASPGATGYTRPLPLGRDQTSKYATAARYDALPAKGKLAPVLMRATLKQFEGFWTGDLGGAFRAQLAFDRGTGKVTPTSWVENQTDIRITGGFLLFLDPRVRDPYDGGPPMRTAGLTTPVRSDRRYRDVVGQVPPALNVLAVSIPALNPGERASDLGAAAYAEYDKAATNWKRGAAEPERRPELPTLWEAQLAWAQPSFLRTDTTHLAAWLASTRDLYLPNSSYAPTFDNVGVEISLEGLVDLDITHWLSRDHAVLLLWSEEPGPGAMLVDGEPARMTAGNALYRVRVPVTYQGSVRREDEE